MTNQEKESVADTFIPIIGAIALAFVIILLLSTPGMLLAKSMIMIDTERSYASENAVFVRTRMDFGDNECLRALPRNVGDWKSMHFNTSRLEKALYADAMLLRVYANPPIPRRNSSSIDLDLEPAPVSFAIIQSANASSFHAPVVCYSVHGYEVEEEGIVQIPLQKVSQWAEGPLYGKAVNETLVYSNVTIPAKKLILVKRAKEDGQVTDREIILYYYVKGSLFSSASLTIIRAAAHAPINGSASEDDRIINSTRTFMGEVFPYMLEIREKEEIIAVQLANSGIGGWLIIVILVSLPLGLIVYSGVKIKKRNGGLT